MFAGAKPNLDFRAAKGEEAPKLPIARASPVKPTYRSQPIGAAASTATLAVPKVTGCARPTASMVIVRIVVLASRSSACAVASASGPPASAGSCFARAVEVMVQAPWAQRRQVVEGKHRILRPASGVGQDARGVEGLHAMSAVHRLAAPRSRAHSDPRGLPRAHSDRAPPCQPAKPRNPDPDARGSVCKANRACASLA
jgi:hypothetical protein